MYSTSTVSLQNGNFLFEKFFVLPRVWILINQIFQGKATSYLRRYLWLIRRVLKSDHCEKSLIVFPMIIDQLTGQHHQYHRHAVSLSLFGHQHQPNNQLTTQLLWSKALLAPFFRLERPFTFLVQVDNNFGWKDKKSRQLCPKLETTNLILGRKPRVHDVKKNYLHFLQDGSAPSVRRRHFQPQFYKRKHEHCL